MAFYEIEPFGDGRADLRAGVVASTVANFSPGPRSKIYKPEDFLMFKEPEDLNEKIIAAFSKVGT